jgi:hypothetical protein
VFVPSEYISILGRIWRDLMASDLEGYGGISPNTIKYNTMKRGFKSLKLYTQNIYTKWRGGKDNAQRENFHSLEQVRLCIYICIYTYIYIYIYTDIYIYIYIYIY